MKNMKKTLRYAISLSLLIFCCLLNSMAQETTGEIQGVVKDASGAVIPNASIIIKGVTVGFNRTVQTDNKGYYRVNQVPPGTYSIKVEAVSGFTAQTKDNVSVSLGNATTIDFEMTTSVSATVDVTTDNVIIDTTETKAQDNLSAKRIEELPKGVTFSSLLNRTSSVRSDAISGQFTINGATGPENSFIVDGQQVQNYRNGVLNTANDIPFQTVQELQVKTSGFEAEFGGATGGVINIATKGGTNDFHGDFGLQFSIPKFNATQRPFYTLYTAPTPSGQNFEYLPQVKPDGTNFFPTASLSGPIVKNKLWFYGIVSPNQFTSINHLSYFTTGLPQTRTLRPGGRFDANQKLTQEYDFIRLDASPFENLRLTASYTYNPFIQKGNVPTNSSTLLSSIPTLPVVGGTTLVGAAALEAQGGRQNSSNFRVEGVWTPSSKLIFVGRYTHGFLNEKLSSYGIPTVTRFQCVYGSGFIPAGTTCSNGFQNVTTNNGINREVSKRDTIDANASYLTNFGGQHEFKGGYQFSRIFNDTLTGYVGLGIVRLCYGIYAGLSCLGAPTGSLTFNPANAPLGIGQLQQFGTVGVASNTAHTIFFQDKWQLTNRLTLNLGLRTEQEALPAFNGFKTGLKFDFTEKMTPRLGVAYSLTADGKTKLSAFYGWFYDRLKFELPRGSFGGNFFHVDTFVIDPAHPEYSYYTLERIQAQVGNPVGGICPVPNAAIGTSVCQNDFRLPSNVPGLSNLLGPDAPADAGTVDPNLKPFRQSEFTFEFQRELIRSSVLTARFLYRNVDHAVEDAGFITPQNSEFYDIANPGEGLHLKHAQQFGFEGVAKPKRLYRALQMEYNTRLLKNFSLNLNYTLSRLTGNYSGLANPDEASGTTGIGRNSPGVNRYFDQPFVAYSASGGEDLGVLPLDRTHVFKASGTYNFDWFGSKTNGTMFTFFTTAQSGTPQTTFITAYQNVSIPYGKRNDLGRVEAFTQTDINLSHRYNFGRDNKFAMVFDLNILNVFNENNVISLDTNLAGLNYSFDYTDVSPDYATAVNRLQRQGVIDIIQAINGTPQTNPDNYNPGYGQPRFFQTGRGVRFGFRFLF